MWCTAADTTNVTASTGLLSSQEFVDYALLYQQYRVVGVKIKFSPYNFVYNGTVAGTQATFRGVICASQTDTNAAYLQAGTSYNLLMRRPDFKEKIGQKGLRKYIGVSKFLRKENQLVWNPTSAPSNLPYHTLVRCTTTVIVTGKHLYTFEVPSSQSSP